MNVFSGALNYIAGNDRVEGISPVRRLVERIKTSSLPQDRRKSIKDLNKAVQEVSIRFFCLFAAVSARSLLF